MFVCESAAVCWCMILCLRPPAVSPKGREKSAATYVFVRLFLSLCVCWCVWSTLQPNHNTGRQSFQRSRGVKKIKHKPTNHRCRLISALLQGEPGRRDDSPLWISQWHSAVCQWEGKVQSKSPVIWPCCNLINWEQRGKVVLNIFHLVSVMWTEHMTEYHHSRNLGRRQQSFISFTN